MSTYQELLAQRAELEKKIEPNAPSSVPRP
jgi:hypothetical protein